MVSSLHQLRTNIYNCISDFKLQILTMAELAIGSASVLVRLVVQFLTKYHTKDQALIEDIKSMQRWLDRMRAAIASNTSSQDQVNQIRDIAYDIEDVLDKFLLHSPHVFRNHRITREVHNVAHNLKFWFPLKNMREEIQNIKRRLKEIKEQHETLHAGSSSSRPESSSSTRNRHRVSPLLPDNELVGYEEERLQFNHELIDGEKRLVNLAVGGPSGSGKTTFVKTIFWEHRIQGRFDCNAWVNVSRHFDLEKLLFNLLKQLCVSRNEPYPAADESLTIHEKIRKYVGKRSYIVVLDDVWRAEDWNSIKDAFPDAYCGSRVIVTTRDLTVCHSSKSSMYFLNGLDGFQSWRLFCIKAFQDTNRECPVELKDCAQKIVKRCEGIPLAIVAVGCALAEKQKDLGVWEKFNDNLGCELENDSHLSAFTNALLQSYMDLSSSLKSCLLYFSIFPEDVSVEYGKLIRLWVAERFAIGTKQQTAEEVASDYLNELIRRNLVHVSKWNLDRPRSCRVINLVHTFIITKRQEENFATISSEHSPSASNKIRRLTFHEDCTDLPQHVDSTGVRSLLLFSCTDESSDYIWNNSRRFQLSRVIDLYGAPLKEFPRHITDLTLLTYICFRDTKIKTIPKSIKKLRYLETLDLKQTDVTELPKEISELHNLRHLLAYKYTVDHAGFDIVQAAVKVFEGIGNLTELQKLSLVRIGERAEILQDLQKLGKLRRLGLTGIKTVHCTDLCRSIEGMRNLSALDLCSDTKDGYIKLDEISNPPDTLQRLFLKGRMKCIPNWITKLRNLLKISLRWSKLEKSPIETLQCLPNLLEIELIDCYIGGELVFKGSSLKKLKVLLIQDLPKLNTIVIEEGSIPDLHKMSLHRCTKLLISPLGIEKLSKLKELVLYDMAQELVDCIRMGGEDRETVEHVPIIHSFTLTTQGWSLRNLSKSFYDRRLAS